MDFNQEYQRRQHATHETKHYSQEVISYIHWPLNLSPNAPSSPVEEIFRRHLGTDSLHHSRQFHGNHLFSRLIARTQILQPFFPEKLFGLVLRTMFQVCLYTTLSVTTNHRYRLPDRSGKRGKIYLADSRQVGTSNAMMMVHV